VTGPGWLYRQGDLGVIMHPILNCRVIGTLYDMPFRLFCAGYEPRSSRHLSGIYSLGHSLDILWVAVGTGHHPILIIFNYY